jgi:hypothetical protein
LSGRAIIIVITGLIIISGVVFHNIEAASTRITENYDDYYLRQCSQDIAQAGACMGLRALATDKTWRTGFPLMDLLSGKVKVTASDSTLFGRKVVKIISVGYSQYGTSRERRDTTITYARRAYVPYPIYGAITTNNAVGTLGSMTVDGRDHDSTGATVIPGKGSWGVWTTKAYSIGGSSTVGGTNAGTDYAPANPGNAAIIKQNQSYPGGYPGSPDSVLGGLSYGYPEGTLKAIAQSGSNGSRYTTNPATLATPLRGVTYVELSSGGTWQSMDITGSGILIVHNSAKNAIMKNLNSGTFKGLLIADDIIHVHATIVGGIVSLTPSPSSGNTFGNGSGSALFSNINILKATEGAIMIPNGSQNAVAWRE